MVLAFQWIAFKFSFILHYKVLQSVLLLYRVVSGLVYYFSMEPGYPPGGPEDRPPPPIGFEMQNVPQDQPPPLGESVFKIIDEKYRMRARHRSSHAVQFAHSKLSSPIPSPSHCAVIVLFKSAPVRQLSWLALKELKVKQLVMKTGICFVI